MIAQRRRKSFNGIHDGPHSADQRRSCVLIYGPDRDRVCIGRDGASASERRKGSPVVAMVREMQAATGGCQEHQRDSLFCRPAPCMHPDLQSQPTTDPTVYRPDMTPFVLLLGISSATALANATPVKVFIMMGQSNVRTKWLPW